MAQNPQALIALGQLGANALAIPEQIRQQQLATRSTREILRQVGLSNEQVERIAPGSDQPPFQFPGGGILRTVGQAGSLLSGALGRPTRRARPDLTALLGARSEQRAQRREARDIAAQQETIRLARGRAERAERSLRLQEQQLAHALGREDRERATRARAIEAAGLPLTPQTQVFIETGTGLPGDKLLDLLIAELSGRAEGRRGIIPMLKDVSDERLRGMLADQSPAEATMAQALRGAGGGVRSVTPLGEDFQAAGQPQTPPTGAFERVFGPGTGQRPAFRERGRRSSGNPAAEAPLTLPANPARALRRRRAQ